MNLREVFSESLENFVFSNSTISINSTNVSTGNSSDVDFSYRTTAHAVVNLLMFLLICLPSLVLNVVNSVAIFFSGKICTVIRVALLNIAFSNVVYLIGLSMYILGFALTIFLQTDRTSLICQFTLVVYYWGFFLRLVGILTFGTVTFITIKFNAQKVNIKALISICAVLWLVSMVGNLPLFIPSYGVIVSDDGLRCTLAGERGNPTPILIHNNVLCTCVGVVCLITTLSLIIAAYCYIRKNSITGNVLMRKALLKFSVFLLTSNCVNFFGFMIVGTLVSSRRQTLVESILLQYVPFLLLSVLSFIAPLSMICIFKFLRVTLSEWMRCKWDCLKKAQQKVKVQPEEQGNSNSKQLEMDHMRMHDVYMFNLQLEVQ